MIGVEDLLSDVIGALKLRASSYYRAELNGAFALRVPHRPRLVRFHLVLRGEIQVATASSSDRVTVRAGDVFLVTMGAPHTLMDEPGRTPVDLEDAKREVGFRPGDQLYWGEGPHKATLMCGEFSGVTELFHPVFGSLPTLVHTPIEDEDELITLAEILDLVDREARNARLGWLAVANRLSEIVMIRVLRSWVHRHPTALKPLSVLRHVRLKKALKVIHDRPEEYWTVQSLAEVAGMSRTSFATEFSERMGTSPMQYLTSWRMEVARSLLHSGDLTLTEVAEQVGYGSQASFTKAFREIVGMPPGAYRGAVAALTQTE